MKEEGFKRCHICDATSDDSGKHLTFQYDKVEDAFICNNCTTSIGESLREFGGDYFEEDVKHIGNSWRTEPKGRSLKPTPYNKPASRKGKVSNFKGRPRKFKGTDPSKVATPVAPTHAERLQRSNVELWEAILAEDGLDVID